MAISERRGAAAGAAIRALAAGAALLAAVAGAGCARSGAAPPEPPAAAGQAAGHAAGRGQAAGTTAGRSPAPSVAQAPAALDPSEEITPEELSTIPEPVPARSSGGTGRNPQAPLPMAQAAPEADSAPIEWPVPVPAPARAAEKPAPTATIPASLWRVQVFTTQDRGLADRMAKEAALTLAVAAHIDYEGSHYKVRLGDFASEEEALPLRERAIRSGYPGAFRTRCATDATRNVN